MVLNLSTERNTPVGESFIPPSPILHVLSSDGHLCSFSCVNTTPGAPSLCTPAPGLPQEGKRQGTVKYPEPSVPKPQSVPTPASLPPPPYSQPKPNLEKSQVQFSSGIFNPSSASFIQSTPVKPFGAVEPSSSTTATGGPFEGLFKPAEGSLFGGGASTPFGGGVSTTFGGGVSTPFGGGASTPFTGFGKPKESVPSPLSKSISKETTPVSKEPTPAPVELTPTLKESTHTPRELTPSLTKPIPPTKEDPTGKPGNVISTRSVPDETAKRRLNRKIDEEFKTFEDKLAALRDTVSSLQIDIGTQVSKRLRLFISTFNEIVIINSIYNGNSRGVFFLIK